jgi:hypothetical protein
MTPAATIMAKFIQQGGDPLAALRLGYALAHSALPDAIEIILADPKTRLEVDCAEQRVRAYDANHGLLCEWSLDVDMRSHLLGHILDQHRAAGGASAYAVAKWVLSDEAEAPISILGGVARGWMKLLIQDGQTLVGMTDEGKRMAERFIAAKPNDPCPCGSGRKSKRCCNGTPKF